MRQCLFLVCGLLCIFGLVACASVGNSSSSASHSSKLVTGEYDQIHIPAYAEYEVLGVVFVTTSEFDKIDSPSLTYLALLKKAADMGGHAIVNVSIEESRNCAKMSRAKYPYRENETACEIQRFGSALAIRYTKAITDPKIINAMKPSNAAVVDESSSSSGKSSSVLSIF